MYLNSYDICLKVKACEKFVLWILDNVTLFIPRYFVTRALKVFFKRTWFTDLVPATLASAVSFKFFLGTT